MPASVWFVGVTGLSEKWLSGFMPTLCSALLMLWRSRQTKHCHHYVRPFAPPALTFECSLRGCQWLVCWRHWIARKVAVQLYAGQTKHCHQCVRPFAPPTLTVECSLRGCQCLVCWRYRIAWKVAVRLCFWFVGFTGLSGSDQSDLAFLLVNEC